MSFQSYTFLFALLPVSVAGWWLLNWRGHGRLAQGFLLVVSLAFYGKGNLAFLPLLLGSILFNFLVGKAMGALPRARKPLLVLGLLGNLGLLGSRLDRLHPALSWALTFGYVNFCWIFFRAGSVREALAMCRAIARCAFGPLAEEFTTSFQMPEITWIGRYLEIDMARLALLMFLLFVVGSMFFCLQETPVARRKHRMTGRRGVLAGILLFWAVISLTGVSRFIYSNF